MSNMDKACNTVKRYIDGEVNMAVQSRPLFYRFGEPPQHTPPPKRDKYHCPELEQLGMKQEHSDSHSYSIAIDANGTALNARYQNGRVEAWLDTDDYYESANIDLDSIATIEQLKALIRLLLVPGANL